MSRSNNAANIGDGLNTLDITGSTNVTDVESVKSTVISIYSHIFPGVDTGNIEQAFQLFDQLYHGKYPGYLACDTIYHDIQHSLDITLTTTRLLKGYQAVHGDLSVKQMLLGIVTALFHDAGYIRKTDDSSTDNGAEYTSSHVSRGAAFMRTHLPSIGLSDICETAGEIVHLTGYEIPEDEIAISNPKDRLIGDMVATADLITQMADRCYIEKCRDRLFPEMILAAKPVIQRSMPVPAYTSAYELLYNTPSFYRLYVRKKLENHFQGVFRYASAFFDGTNLYIEKIENNIRYIENLINKNNINRLRRQLPGNYGETVFPFEQVQPIIAGKLTSA